MVLAPMVVHLTQVSPAPVQISEGWEGVGARYSLQGLPITSIAM